MRSGAGRGRRLRVAMVTLRGPSRSGAGELLGPLAVELAGRGVEVEVLTRAEGDPVVRRVGQGVVVRELAAGPAQPVPADDLLVITDEFGEAVARLGRAGAVGLDGSGFDVIHAHDRDAGLAVLPVAIELGVPLVLSIDATGDAPGRGAGDAPPHAVRIAGFLAAQASAVIAASAGELPALLDRAGAPADRVWVVPPGVDTALFHPDRVRTAEDALRDELDAPHERPILLVPEGAGPADGAELAVRALAELHSLRGWAPVLVIVAETPSAARTAQLTAVARAAGVDADVRFATAGSRERLADLLSCAALLIDPCSGEGSSPDGPFAAAPALESAASGTPVVRAVDPLDPADADPAHPAGGPDEVPGVRVTGRDPRDWARALAGLLDDQVALDALSSAARRHAEGRTWAATAAALIGVYAAVVGRPSGTGPDEADPGDAASSDTPSDDTGPDGPDS